MSSLTRFFLGDAQYAKGSYYLKDENILKHARKVLRLQKGSRVELFDGKGKTILSEIELLTKEVLVAKIIEEKVSDDSKKLHITLAQALPKAGKIDNILRMNTEIGVSGFVLFESDHSIVKKEHYKEQKIIRLNKIIQEASRQSRNDYIPQITGPIEFQKMLSTDSDRKILLHTDSAGEKLSDIKMSLKKNSSIVVCVGPEGGFSKTEVQSALTKGFQIVKLDLPVLRTETVGLVVCSYLLI